MKRERATTLLNDMLDRLEEGGWPLDLVDEILVFGSYARGALTPSDVDLVVEHRRDDRLASEFLHALSYGRNPSASMKGIAAACRSTSENARPSKRKDSD
ncbi:nucleotidyltransferase domain-containing protein [Streptomyces sp. NPDC004561]